MKNTNTYDYYASHAMKKCRYPNAAGARYFLGKVVDLLLAAAISVSLVTIFLFALLFI